MDKKQLEKRNEEKVLLLIVGLTALHILTKNRVKVINNYYVLDHLGNLAYYKRSVL